MKIRWLGHSCFLITNAAGGRLITDPFDASVGYPLPMARADVVTMSHEHHDHNCLDGVKNADEARILHGLNMEPGEVTEAAGFRLRAVRTCHDDAGGSKRGGNAVFVIEADDVRLAHLGDLGHEPSGAQYAQMGPVDALLIPVGGFYTIDGKTARAVAEKLSPAVTLPMHYKTAYNADWPITGPEEFLGGIPEEDIRRDIEALRITAGDLRCQPRAALFKA